MLQRRLDCDALAAQTESTERYERAASLESTAKKRASRVTREDRPKGASRLTESTGCHERTEADATASVAPYRTKCVGLDDG